MLHLLGLASNNHNTVICLPCEKVQPRVGNNGPPAQRRLWLVLGSPRFTKSLFPSVPSKVIVDVHALPLIQRACLPII